MGVFNFEASYTEYDRFRYDGAGKPMHTLTKSISIILCSILFVSSVSPFAQSTDETNREAILPSPKNGGVYVVAHRGAHNGIPENSLPAYEKAIELGADFVEIDVRTTRDGNLVSIHNATIDAYVERRTGKVNEMTLAELRTLDIGVRVDSKWKGTRIPTFEEILSLCKGRIGIYLDLKDADVGEVVDVIREYNMEQEIIWYASPRNLEKLGKLCEQCIPMPDPYTEKNLPKIIERFKPDVIAATWDDYSKRFVETCHDAGAIVIVDESDPSCWEDAVAWGSDGIQTDHPEELIAYLKSRTNDL
jgi:glycerophosphoryl diester phosphodiesterase